MHRVYAIHSSLSCIYTTLKKDVQEYSDTKCLLKHGLLQWLQRSLSAQVFIHYSHISSPDPSGGGLGTPVWFSYTADFLYLA